MYRTDTFPPRKLMTAMAATMFLVAGSALAGPPQAAPPGKPGNNDILADGNIVEVAIAANDALGVFNTVLAAAQCGYFEGAVVDILAGDDRVTLFAPTDAAFDELGLDAGNVCAAFDDGVAGTPGDLLTILAYHVSDGRRFTNSLFNPNGNAKEVDMLMGGSITTAEDNIYDNNMREVNTVEPFVDINASNGVIHVINRVLLP